MIANATVRSAAILSNFRERVRDQLRVSEKGIVKAFFKLADKRIRREWILAVLGAVAFAAYLLVLFLGPYRR